MSSKTSFEQLCMSENHGYSFDESTAYQPEDPENFEEVIIKLSSKIETSIFLIESHKGQLEEFTLVSVPLPQVQTKGYSKAKQFIQQGQRNMCVEEIWRSMNNIGWDSMQVLAVLTNQSIPDNGSRVYSLSTFVTCLLESLKAYFLFQKPKLSYAWSELSNTSESSEGGFALALVWKNNPDSEVIVPVPQKKMGRRSIATPVTKRLNIDEDRFFKQSPFRRELLVDEEEDPEVPVPQKKRGRRSIATPVTKRLKIDEDRFFKQSPFRRELPVDDEEDDPEDSESEVDVEITFKDFKPPMRTPSPIKLASPVKQAVSSRSRRVVGRVRPLRAEKIEMPEEEPMETETLANSSLANVTLGFELSANTPSRKSGMRKSLVPDWPEEEKSLILTLFDNLNPNISETKRIVLTCRYVLIQYEKELTSKLLYTWIQKKGRKPERTIESFELNEAEKKAEMIDFFSSLNPSQPENARIAFTLKYFQAQFNVNLPSKQLYDWLNNKPVKKGKKSMR